MYFKYKNPVLAFITVLIGRKVNLAADLPYSEKINAKLASCLGGGSQEEAGKCCALTTCQWVAIMAASVANANQLRNHFQGR